MLHVAVMKNDIRAVEILLRHRDLDIHRLNFEGESALTLAAEAYDGQEQRRN